VQNKVLEALAMGKPVVSSPGALAGLGKRPDLPAIQVSSQKEWVETILRLLTDPARCRSLGVQGREYVERNHSWPACLAAVNDLLELSHEQREPS
jgi:glycosyltransferase involved in cell wall biosynthesis